MESPNRKLDLVDEEDEDKREISSPDVTSFSNSSDDSGLGDKEDEEDVGEFSSSFDDSGFGDEEDEAQSMLFNDYSFSNKSKILGLRKRKRSKQWSRYSLQISWRCKWAELKVKELHSRVRKYIREIESYSQGKNWELNKLKLEGFEGKSFTYPYHSYRTIVYKRQKRIQMEDRTDIAAYTSNHNLFSYGEKWIPAACKAWYPLTEKRIPGTFKVPRSMAEMQIPGSFKVPNPITGYKTAIKGGFEDDCVVSELDRLMEKILSKIKAAKEKLSLLRKRVDQLIQQSEEKQKLSEEYLRINSPGGEVVLMEESEEERDDEQLLDYFTKQLNSIRGVSEEEGDANLEHLEQDLDTRVANKNSMSQRKR